MTNVHKLCFILKLILFLTLLILVALGVGVFLCPLTLFKSKPAPVDFSELSKVVKRLCDELLKKLI